MAYPSTFGDITDQVIANVRLDAEADLQRTKDWINQVYAEVCVDTESSQDFDTMTMTAGTKTYTLDNAIVRIKQMYVTPSGQQGSRPLVPTSIEQILEWSAETVPSGESTHYALLGNDQIQFYPTPTGADTITLYYVKVPTELVAVDDVPSLQEPYATDCLVWGASFRAATFLKDPDAVLFKQLYDAALGKFRGHLRRKEGSMARQFRITRGNQVIPSDPSVDRGW